METKKFNLGHVSLYAKGWYNKSDDIWADLKQILNLDNYGPCNKNDVFNIIVRRFEEANLVYNPIIDMLDNIAPHNCWRVGYYTKNYTRFLSLNKPNVEYDLHTAVLYYVLSVLRIAEVSKLKMVTPKYSKENKRPDNISLKTVIDMFNRKKVTEPVTN